MYFRWLHDEPSGCVSYLMADLVFSGHAGGSRIVSRVHELRREHPWFAGAGRDDFLARVRGWPRPASVRTVSRPRHALRATGGRSWTPR